MILYTTGYTGKKNEPTGKKVAAFREMVGRRNLVVIDTRLNPFSMAPCWREWGLRESLKDRYHYIQSFGNVNYRTGGPIRIKDFEDGFKTLRNIVSARDWSPLLLCACEDLNRCHRKTVAECLLSTGLFEQTVELRNWSEDSEGGALCLTP